MLNETQTTTEPFIVTRDGEIDPTFKRKVIIKRVKATLRFTADISAVVTVKAVNWSVDKIEELTRPVRLDYFDHKYGTNLRAQYFSGLRTQQILKAKRQHGLA